MERLALFFALLACASPAWSKECSLCSTQHNWYRCVGRADGAGVRCEVNAVQNTREPLALIWKPHDRHDLSEDEGYQFLYNAIIHDGVIKLSLRFCKTEDEYRVKIPDRHCDSSSYRCEVHNGKVNCVIKICPWSDSIVPESGKPSNWNECVQKDNQTDCYISILTEPFEWSSGDGGKVDESEWSDSGKKGDSHYDTWWPWKDYGSDGHPTWEGSGSSEHTEDGHDGWEGSGGGDHEGHNGHHSYHSGDEGSGDYGGDDYGSSVHKVYSIDDDTRSQLGRILEEISNQRYPVVFSKLPRS